MFRSRTVRGSVRGISLALTLVALCGFSKQGQAGIIVPGTEQAHIDFAADPVFAPVGWVSGWDGAAWRTVGSGTLVKSDKVLLSGHQLTTFGYTQFRFSLGPSVFQPNTGRSVASSYDILGSGGNLFTPDLGVLTLVDPITSVTPAEVYMGDELAEGMRIIWAGYGIPGYYPSGELSFDGLKRGGENKINSFGPTDRFRFDFGPAYGTPSLPLEMGASNFDSGAGAFGFIDNEWQLVGVVVSRSGFEDSFAVRPFMQMDFLNATGVVSVPEPSTILLATLGAGVVALYCRRRKA